MKKARHLLNPLKLLCSFLILIAPLIVTESVSIYFWGEPEIPEELQSYQTS